MDGFALLLGHLVGDYILQNDVMARDKTNQHPGKEPLDPFDACEWRARMQAWRDGNAVCTSHCLLYTLSVWLFSFWWMPWWGLAVCFAAHWPIDRFRLARKWMESVSGQREFANGVFSPWSIIVVDNIFHLLTLFVIAAAAGKVG